MAIASIANLEKVETSQGASINHTADRRSRLGGPDESETQKMQETDHVDNVDTGYKAPAPQESLRGIEKSGAAGFSFYESQLTAGETGDNTSTHNRSYSGTNSQSSNLIYSANGVSSKNQKRMPKKLNREMLSLPTINSEGLMSQESEVVVVKQRIAYLCIAISALQLTLLLSQLILCGVAPVDVNPMIGPFPDAFSEWGGKNSYLLIERNQYFRLLTPAFLHVGILHLLVNAFCQLETCAYFEREWGSTKWLVLYIISSLGCVATSSAVNPDSIGVCSSGALMGLFGAKIAHVITWTAFDLKNNAYYDTVHLDQLSGVMCSMAVISLVSSFTYIDFSGHVGGLLAGFMGGMLLFAREIASPFIRMLWGSIGLFGLVGGSIVLGNVLFNETFPDEDLADACSYFRNLFPEGYTCECAWN
ncbi:unnamed protein product [Cylindrotheca closterium]|uniref:rhomboid protease n=1 Tax=Cylindrotheca closterium TaxID=2856 RepID=A0AAD2FZR8_9STRA|nr:unnamed protein product [Cylindrotheca closterium]